MDLATRARLARKGGGDAADLLAAGRLAYEQLDYPRADSLFSKALDVTPAGEAGAAARTRSAARVGRAWVMQKRREWDASLAELKLALADYADAVALETLARTLIRLGRTDETIAAGEWAVRLHPYHDASHYLLGNGYARKNYTQLSAAYPGAFADSGGRRLLSAADGALAT